MARPVSSARFLQLAPEAFPLLRASAQPRRGRAGGNDSRNLRAPPCCAAYRCILALGHISKAYPRLLRLTRCRELPLPQRLARYPKLGDEGFRPSVVLMQCHAKCCHAFAQDSTERTSRDRRGRIVARPLGPIHGQLGIPSHCTPQFQSSRSATERHLHRAIPQVGFWVRSGLQAPHSNTEFVPQNCVATLDRPSRSPLREWCFRRPKLRR